MVRVNYSYFQDNGGDCFNHWGHMDIPLPAKTGGLAFDGQSHDDTVIVWSTGVGIVSCEPPTILLP